MGVDFIILGFTMVALLGKHRTRSDLWNLLFRAGLVYFVLTFACNAVPAVRKITFAPRLIFKSFSRYTDFQRAEPKQ